MTLKSMTLYKQYYDVTIREDKDTSPPLQTTVYEQICLCTFRCVFHEPSCSVAICYDNDGNSFPTNKASQQIKLYSPTDHIETSHLNAEQCGVCFVQD